MDGGTARIHRGPQSVRVSMDRTLIDRHETKVKDGTLPLGFKCGLNMAVIKTINHLKYCDVDITIPGLDGIVLNGVGTMIVDAGSQEEAKVYGR